MFQLFSNWQIIRYIAMVGGFFFALIFVPLLIFTEMSDIRLLSVSLGSAATVTTVLIFGLGHPRCFNKIWKLFDWYYPSLHGTYKGKIESNWSLKEIERAAALGETPPLKREQLNLNHTPAKLVDITLWVECSLFGIKITASSENQYTESYTLASRPTKHADKIGPEICYVFVGRNPKPLSTDTSQYHGSALLRVEQSPNGLALKGAYWTDRAYTDGLNTAGQISVHKTSDKIEK